MRGLRHAARAAVCSAARVRHRGPRQHTAGPSEDHAAKNRPWNADAASARAISASAGSATATSCGAAGSAARGSSDWTSAMLAGLTQG